MLFPPCRQILMIRNPLFFSGLYLATILPHKSWRFKIEFLLRRWLISSSAKSSTITMTASRSMYEDVRRFIRIENHKGAVNRFGVPLEKFTVKPKKTGRRQKGSFRILYVSEYSDYKNLTTLLKAFLLLRKKEAGDFSLITTADPGQFPNVEITTRAIDTALANDPRVAPYITFTGALPYEQIQNLYTECDFFVFPSLAESFGHPLVEAMASEMPIIASDIPICREICSEAALYFSPLDARDLAEKITLLRNNSGLRQKLARIGRDRAERYFDWKDHVGRLVEIIENIAERG